MAKKILDSIPKDLLDKYISYQMSSKTLAGLTGFHEVSIRRAIPRGDRPVIQRSKTKLLEARKKYRATLAHLPPREIKTLANVSLSTANRIRKMRSTVNSFELTQEEIK